MIRINSRCAQRTKIIRCAFVDRVSVIPPSSRIRHLPHRCSTSSAPTTHSVDIRDPQPTVSVEDELNPYKYTSGRWLRRDKLERDARILNFDFDALRKRVVELCPGASSVASYEKKEGGYNRTFIFTCDNARRVVARLPTSVAGPARLTTHSEVATITYVQSNTTAPTPKILDWSDDSSNAIGSEYIITEHAEGVQLHQKWPTMSGEQQIACIRAICKSVQQIAAIDFPAYGSLYFANVSLHSASTLPLTQGFWSDLTAYCDALIDTGISRLPADEITLSCKPPYHGNVAAHVHLLNVGREVIQKLAEDARVRGAAAATLFHADLHSRNIFVSDEDPTVVTDLIDWQSSSIEPAFAYADYVPDIATPILDASPEETPAATQAALCRRVFDACLQVLIPKLYAARALNDELLRPIRYCHRTWKDGAVAFKHELIETSGRWKELGLAGSCPYVIPASEELLEHQREYESFVTAIQLKQKLMDLLDTNADGWVPTTLLEATEVANKEVFDEVVQNLRGSESIDTQSMSEENMRRIWPFDIK